MQRTILSISLAFLLILPENKKEQLLQLSKKYFPENYAVLKEYEELFINEMANGSNLKDYLTDIPTVVHEGYHSYITKYSSYHDEQVLFRINDTLTFSLNNMRTFPSKEINTIVPDSIRKKIFRYDTYVNAESRHHVTQQFGILGLVEEQAAYYQSLHTAIALLNYGWDKFDKKNPAEWMNLLGRTASYRYSITEFELFISWYIQFAKAKYPAHYKEIMGNHELRKMLRYIHVEDARLSTLYDKHRSELMKKFDGRLIMRENFIVDMKTLNGTGLYEDELKDMKRLLSKPEHRPFLEWIK